jgi:hypothetical protein
LSLAEGIMTPLELIEAKRRHLARLANQHGAAGESAALVDMANWLPRPRGFGLKVLLQALKDTGVLIKGSSFDAVSVPASSALDFSDPVEVRATLDQMVFIEIKTANQARVGPDFAGFFFALTEAEIAAAEVLGDRHRVALYNNQTGMLLLTSVPEILARARSTNWQVSVQL